MIDAASPAGGKTVPVFSNIFDFSAADEEMFGEPLNELLFGCGAAIRIARILVSKDEGNLRKISKGLSAEDNSATLMEIASTRQTLADFVDLIRVAETRLLTAAKSVHGEDFTAT